MSEPSKNVPKNAPRVATVIVNYKAGALVAKYLPSLLAEHRALPGSSIVIVDNASPGDDLAVLRAAAAAADETPVTVIASPENGGFAKGNNIALRALLEGDDPAPDYVFLLNPDAYLRPGALTTLVDFLERRPQAGIVGSRLEGEDGAAQISAFRYFSIASEFESAANTGVVSSLLSGARVAPAQSDETRRADWVCGAATLIRREVFEDVGLFDETYFLYFEETDFMLQADRAGWETWYAPESRAVHLVGRSTGVTDGKLEEKMTPAYWYQSRAHYFRKNHGAVYAFFADAAWLAGAMFYFVRAKLTGKDDGSLWPSIRRFAKSQFGGGLTQAPADDKNKNKAKALEANDHG